MEVILSVLIPSTYNRRDMTTELMLKIATQFRLLRKEKEVEVICDWHETDCVGVKRNRLLDWANGEYIVFVDSDDHVSDDYISKILTACQSNADCIGISGIVTTNGSDMRQWHISKDYGKWYTGVDGTYYRTPNHISPVKRELALQAGFPEIPFGEDAEYSRRLLPLIKTETKVEGNIYHYDYVSNK